MLSARTAFSGHVIRVEVLKIRCGSGHCLERELIRHPGAAVIIPRLPDGRLVLLRQLRVATGGNIWEFPAGTLEKGESAFQCAKRELQEETGWVPGRLRKALEFFPTPGISTEKMYLFVADDLHKAKTQKPDLDEELMVRSFPACKVEEMIEKGSIIDGKTILGFLLLQKRFSNR